MAVISTPQAGRLTVSVMENVGGKETVHARNFPGLKAAATDQAVYDTGSAIAGLQSLPRDVYEAARLDKASRWTILRRITLPLMTPTLSFVFIMKFINAFKSFSAIDVMTQGGPQGSSMVLGYWIYNAGRVKFNYGFAMVGAIVLTALVAVFTLLANKGFRKED